MNSVKTYRTQLIDSIKKIETDGLSDEIDKTLYSKVIEDQKVFFWIRLYLKEEDLNTKIGDDIIISYKPLTTLTNESSEESEELDKTLEYSNGKLFDAFNFAKSIWNVAYETVEISLKKNKDNLIAKVGYIFHYKKVADKIFVWEYKLKIPKGDITNIKTFITKIYEESPNDNNLVSIIETSSTFTKIENKIELPIFEMKCNQNFPMEQTIVPIMKRKLMSYIFQVMNIKKTDNFDSKL